MPTKRTTRREVAGAETRSRASRLYARILRKKVPIKQVAAATPHPLGGNYGSPDSRTVYVRQVLTGDRTSARMVEALEAAFARLAAPEGGEQR